MAKTSRLVAIEGNTGCGKTELIQWLSSFPDVESREEPINTWRNFYGHNLLELRYSNPKRWSFAFQSLVQLSRLKMYEEVKGVRIIERSIHSNRYCFMEAAKEMEHFDEIEHALLTEWFQYFTKDARTQLDLIVYLRTSPEISLQRIKSRKRSEEENIILNQLQTIHDKYESWISSGASGFKVAIINANCDKNTVKESVVSHLKENHIF